MINQGVGSWVHRRRIKSRGRTALISSAGELTYDELALRIDRLANALADRGVKQGDRVAYLGENSPAFLEALFAAGTIGATFVPLNTRLAPPEITYALRDSGARVLFASDSLYPLADSGSTGTEVERTIVVADHARQRAEGAPGGDRAEEFEQVLASGAEQRPEVAVGHDDPAAILYTSGTTGNPDRKSVV